MLPTYCSYTNYYPIDAVYIYMQGYCSISFMDAAYKPGFLIEACQDCIP